MKAKKPMTDLELISAIENVSSDTPRKVVEGLTLRIGTKIRNQVRVPANDSNYEMWEWVWFEIYRNLKSEIVGLRKEIKRIRE